MKEEEMIIVPEDLSPEEILKATEKKQKLPKGALWGIIGGAAALVIAAVVILIIYLTNQGDCDHIDLNDDSICDECGIAYEDGYEVPTSVIVFTTKMDTGEIIPGVRFTVTRGAMSYTLTTGSDGTVKLALPHGAYSVSFDGNTTPDHCVPKSNGFKSEEGKDSVIFMFTDDTPDGSQLKPFTIVDELTDLTLAQGQELYYTLGGAGDRIITINNAEGLVLTYTQKVNGVDKTETFTAEDGTLVATLNSEAGSENMSISLKNTSSATIETQIHLQIPLGAYENPIIIGNDEVEVTVNKGATVHYKFVADEAGALTVGTSSQYGAVSVTKLTYVEVDGKIEVIPEQTGASFGNPVTIEVESGTEIILGVSSDLNGTDTVVLNVSFNP